MTPNMTTDVDFDQLARWGRMHSPQPSTTITGLTEIELIKRDLDEAWRNDCTDGLDKVIKSLQKRIQELESK